MKKTNKKGFTIVELVIVIAVIAILAAVLIPTFSNVIEKANKSAALQEAKNAYTAIIADDIADGTLDKEVDGTAIVLANYGTGITYTCENGACTTFVMENANGYKATLNVATGEWTVAKIGA